MTDAVNILLVDDEPGMLRYIRTLLEVDDYSVQTASTGEEALQQVEKGLRPDLVLLDLLMPGIDGLQTLEQLRQLVPGLKVVMLSCVSDTRKVVQAIRLGAHDYLTKPFQKAELDKVIDQCLGKNQQNLPGEVEELYDDVFFVAASPAMRKIRSQAALVANVDIPVLMLGESGTGKEVVARLIHKLSPRAHRTFLKVNCAAVPGDLLESELFGYEVGAMPPLLQAKLLHVLQDQQFSRLGSRSVIKVDVRILAATNINIPEALANKRLREDLYYRLNAFTMTVPPLRDRREEIPLLLMHFMSSLAQKFGKNTLPISDRLVQECLRYPWPGNLRELGNFVKRYLVLGDENLAVEELQIKSKEGPGDPDGFSVLSSGRGGLKALVRGLKDDAEAKEIQRALEDTNWNRKLAATQLHISYKALLYKVKQHGLSPSAGKESRMRATRVV